MSESSRKKEGEKIIATNASARANYFIDESLEAGLVLQGTEVKSLRMQSPNLKESYIDIRPRNKNSERLEAWLVQTHIAPYSHGNIWNHEPLRQRKLLLKKGEIENLFGAITRKGYTIVPLRLYFKNGIAKIEIGLGKGKNKGDKRSDIQSRDADREMSRALKQSKHYSKSRD